MKAVSETETGPRMGVKVFIKFPNSKNARDAITGSLIQLIPFVLISNSFNFTRQKERHNRNLGFWPIDPDA